MWYKFNEMLSKIESEHLFKIESNSHLIFNRLVQKKERATNDTQMIP